MSGDNHWDVVAVESWKMPEKWGATLPGSRLPKLRALARGVTAPAPWRGWEKEMREDWKALKTVPGLTQGTEQNQARKRELRSVLLITLLTANTMTWARRLCEMIPLHRSTEHCATHRTRP